jgi:hypothetical protein
VRERLAAQAQERLAAFERLASKLRVLSRSSVGDPGAHALDLVISDAVTEIEVSEGRSVVVDDSAAGACVRGSADALRTAIGGLLEYGVAATPPGETVRVGVTADSRAAVVTIDAAAAPSPGGDEVSAPGPDLRGDFGVVLAGALVAELGGDVRIGPGADGGLRLVLSVPLGQPRAGG